MDNPFSWDYLTTTPGSNEVFGAFAILFLILFGTGFIVSLAVYSGWTRSLFPHPVLHRMAQRWATIALVVFSIGLFFFLIRVLQINPLSFGMRLWLWLSLLAFALMLLYFAYDARTHYATAKAAYEERRRKEQYLRPGGAVRVTGPGAPLVSGARPVKRRRK